MFPPVNFFKVLFAFCLGVYGLTACTSAPPEISKLKYDGQYNILFISQNIYRASANFEVDQHQIKGHIINTENQSFKVVGNVLNSGKVELIHVETELQAPIQM